MAEPMMTPEGKYASLMPTDGEELLKTWELNSEAWHTTSVKISLLVPGTNQVSLLASIPLSEYNLESLAREFGPGRYRIQAGPGTPTRKQTEINVSQVYANRAGWAQVPERISASEAMASRTYHAAQQGPVDSLALAQMVELAVLKATQRAPEPVRTDNGMDALTLVLKGFDLAGTLQTKAMETVKSMAGLPSGQPMVEREPASMGDVLLQLGPSILDTIKTIVSQPVQPRPQQPQPRPQQPQQPKPLETLTVRNPNMQQQPQSEKPNIPEITEQEAQAIAPIIGILQPQAEKLIPWINGPMPASLLAGQLCGMMGPDLDLPAMALGDVVERVGSGILAVIHPGLACDKGAEVVRAVSAKIRSEMEMEEEGNGESEP